MLGNNRDPDKKGQEQPKKFPTNPFNKVGTSSASSVPNKPIVGKPVEKPKMDNFQRTNKADRGTGQLNAGSNMNLTQAPPENRKFTETSLDDGATIIKYDVPQKIDNLIMDAKSRMGGENSKFFSKGWVIGNELAKISPDGLSITYYPREVSDLVQELIGYPMNEE